MPKKAIILIIFALLIPLAYSNGGCIKIADDIFVQLSSSPIVPIANEQTSFLISFGNKQGLINEILSGNVSIVKNKENIFTKDFTTKNGILDLKYTFRDSGLYEIFLEFKIKDKTYMPEDFLIEVKDKGKNLVSQNFLFLILGIVIGVGLVVIIKKIHPK